MSPTPGKSECLLARGLALMLALSSWLGCVGVVSPTEFENSADVAAVAGSDGDVAVSSAGDTGGPSTPPGDGGYVEEPPLEPELYISDYPLAVWSDTILDDGVQWVGAGQGPVVLAANGSTLWRIDGDAVSEVTVGSKLDPGDIIAMATLPTGEVLVAGVDSLYVVDGDTLGTWSGSNALSGLTFTDLVSSGTSGDPLLWIAASNGLHLWSTGGVSKVVPQGMGARDARLSARGDTVWVAAEGDVYAMDLVDGQWTPGPLERADVEASALAADGGDRLWLVSDGQVSYRGGDGVWKDLPEALPGSRAWAHPGAKAAWLQSTQGLWMVNGPSVRPVDSSLVADVGAVDGEGRLWVGGPSGLHRLSPGRSVSLLGWPADNVIGGPVTFVLELETPDQIQTISATVGGHTLTVLEDPWAVEVVPASYGEGAHTLNITVDYVDTSLSSSLSLTFTVVLVSWTDDIEPIATPRCATCHGANGSSGLKLFNAAQWKTYHSMIVPVVESGVMPPGGNLNPEEVQLIKLWGKAGFPE